MVASLFALHPENWKHGDDGVTNFGASFRRLAAESGSIESRFTALLNANHEELAVHLRHAVSLMRSKSIPVDWAQLLRDIQFWNAESRAVQRDWARAFWSSSPQPTQAEAESEQKQQAAV